MIKPKAVSLNENEIRLAKMCKALGNPIRLAIVDHLRGCQPCMCGSVVASLPLAQSTISQHLKILKEAGLVTAIVDGPAVCYSINAGAFDWLEEQVVALASPASCSEYHKKPDCYR